MECYYSFAQHHRNTQCWIFQDARQHKPIFLSLKLELLIWFNYLNLLDTRQHEYKEMQRHGLLEIIELTRTPSAFPPGFQLVDWFVFTELLLSIAFKRNCLQ